MFGIKKISNNYELGRFGEDLAVKHLRKNGYKILERNYEKPTGEIDIIVQKGSYIVFCEVKLRKSLEKGRPREAVNFYKQRKIFKTAQYYIAENNIENADFRFDVIEIIDKKIEHIENAFSGEF